MAPTLTVGRRVAMDTRGAPPQRAARRHLGRCGAR